jgi:hypothetical protein
MGLELDLAREPLHDSHELAPRDGRVVGVDREEVEHARAAVGRLPRRAQHERAVEVVALAFGAGGARSEREVPAALGVEQPGEHAAGVQALQAAPVDGAAAVHESGRVAVGYQPVLADPVAFAHPSHRDTIS